MGLPLSHFNNLRDDSQPTSQSRAYWNQALHDELAAMIIQAETLMRDGRLDNNQPGLGYDVAPVARADTFFIQPRCAEKWYLEEIRLPHGQLQALGTQVFTLLDDASTVTYASDTGTVTVTGAPSGVLPAEVQVFYRVADGAVAAASASYRITDVKVVVVSTTITITGHKAMFALPSVLEADDPAEYVTSSNFVTAVDVYRVTVNAQLPVTIRWDGVGVDASSDPTADVTQTGTARIITAENSSVRIRPATYSGGAHVFAYPTYASAPDGLMVNYIAGKTWEDTAYQRLSSPLEIAVLRLANTLSRDLAHWLNDPARIKWTGDRSLPTKENPLQPGEEHCPYGLTNGARFAWMIVQQNRLFRMPF
jgi:hypothetical protein